jgi:hypothetical protein
MRKRRQQIVAWALAGVLALSAGLGCEDKDTLPPEVVAARQEQERQARLPKKPQYPTTQELLTGPKTRLRLATFPLSVEVPKGWSLASSTVEGGPITLTGQGSSGDITLQLVHQSGTVAAGRLEDIVSSAKKELAAKPHPVNRAELRPLGPAKVLEQRMISSELVGGKLPPEVWGDVEITSERDPRTSVKVRSILNPHMLKWTFTVFLPPANDQHATRALTFMSLKLSEFEQDREFLEQLMKSLQYEE